MEADHYQNKRERERLLNVDILKTDVMRNIHEYFVHEKEEVIS